MSENAKEYWKGFMWMFGLVSLAIALFAVGRWVRLQALQERQPCTLAHERAPAPLPDKTRFPDFPSKGMYYVGDARCNALGNCVAEGVRNSCAPTRDARAEKTTFVFPQMSCGGYDDEHDTLVVYPDKTCLFVSACPANCP